MRTAMLLMGAVAIAGDAVAQPATDGDYAPALRRMIAETAAGRCPADIMAEALLAACREQLPTLGPDLASLGAIRDVSFVKAEDRDGQRVETYAVRHAGGRTMILSIGDRRDGRFGAAYTLGQ